MWRALVVFVGLLVIAWLEFQFFPGHDYSGHASQVYLPILQHLATPGYLSRDLIAAHPNVTYTAYDEATLFLHAAGRLSLEQALAVQQIICRLAGLFGIFLLARSAGLQAFASAAVSALVNLGAFLPGPDISLINPEPIARSFAVGFTLLAMGFFARAKPLLSSLFAGLALIYDPAISCLFWIPVLFAFGADRHMRRLVRPMLPVLLVFMLLLANLAQLQPGTPDEQPLFARFSDHVASIERFRAPELWVTVWPRGSVHLYIAIVIVTIAAITRLWTILNRPLKWLLVSMPILGLLSIPFSAIFLDQYRFSALLRLRPLESVIYIALIGWFISAVAAGQALRRRSSVEAVAWSVLCCLVPLLHRTTSDQRPNRAVRQLALWAEGNTWGSSMFLFPDAGRDSYPGMFRAESRRAVWVDWASGAQIDCDVDLAEEWWRRWHDTMAVPLSGNQLQLMLSLPIDYFVFRRNDVLETDLEGKIVPVKPVFSNTEFSVYEASGLRIIPGRLVIWRHQPPSRM